MSKLQSLCEGGHQHNSRMWLYYDAATCFSFVIITVELYVRLMQPLPPKAVFTANGLQLFVHNDFWSRLLLNRMVGYNISIVD